MASFNGRDTAQTTGGTARTKRRQRERNMTDLVGASTATRRATQWLWRTAVAGSVIAAACVPADARTVGVASPDGTIRVALSDDGGHLRYRVTAGGQPILAPSPIGLRVDGIDLGEGATIGVVRQRRVDRRYPFHGGKAVARDHAIVATIAITAQGRRFDADVQVADDGVGVRLRLPARAGQTVQAEGSGWQLADADPQVWATALDAGYEGIYRATTLRALGTAAVGLPLTAKLGRYWVTLSEAAVVDYGDMGVARDAAGLLRGTLYADPKGCTTDAAVDQPWRVTIIARDLTGLVNTTLVQNLNPPPSPALASAPWIRPGRSTWQWLAIGAPLESDQRQWVDWTQALGYEYYLIDEGWAAWSRPWESLAETVRYAQSRGVGVWVWVHSKETVDPAARRALFQRLAQTGVVGVKIDFPEPDSRQWSNWYADTARDAAADRLMVDFHGAAKPTGTERTWPNVLTREGVRGHEWQITRYKRVLPPEHDTILPFTRYVVGPGDYTPTVFDPKELQGNSWAHELAQMVLFTSPYLSMGGHPQTYLTNPARDVLEAVPAVWDETVVLPGSAPGSLAGFARRRGTSGFVAVINGRDARDLAIALPFLGNGRWSLVSYADDPARADAYNRTQRIVGPQDTIRTRLRAQGGFVGWLQPAR